MIQSGGYEPSDLLINPDPVPLPHVILKIPIPAGKTLNHFYGSAKGMQAILNDLNAFIYFTRGGWEYRNGRTMRRRGLSGGEDVGAVKRT